MNNSGSLRNALGERNSNPIPAAASHEESDTCEIYMDKDKAIKSVLRHADEFAHLSLITDSELLKLYGEEVVAAITGLERSGQQEDVCLRCGGQCCRDIGCELYAPQFDQCPIYEFRPIACRLHFCHRFDAAGRSLVLALTG